MNSKTRTLIRDIQNKIRNPITREREFSTEEAVIDYAVRTIYDLMKKQRLLWNQHPTKSQFPWHQISWQRCAWFNRRYQNPPPIKKFLTDLLIQDLPMLSRPFTQEVSWTRRLTRRVWSNCQIIFVRQLTVEIRWVPIIYKVLPLLCQIILAALLDHRLSHTAIVLYPWFL